MFSSRRRSSAKQIGTALTRWLAVLCSIICSAAFGQTPPNDDFANAIVLYGNSTTFSGTLSNATFESGESLDGCNVYNFPGGSVWWTWTATNSTAVVIDMLESTGAYTAGLGVHTGSDAASLNDVDCIALDEIANDIFASRRPPERRTTSAHGDRTAHLVSGSLRPMRLSSSARRSPRRSLRRGARCLASLPEVCRR